MKITNLPSPLWTEERLIYTWKKLHRNQTLNPSIWKVIGWGALQKKVQLLSCLRRLNFLGNQTRQPHDDIASKFKICKHQTGESLRNDRNIRHKPQIRNLEKDFRSHWRLWHGQKTKLSPHWNGKGILCNIHRC